MTAEHENDIVGDADGDAAESETVEQIVEETRDDIRHGHIEEDVSTVLEDRLEAVGVDLRPEAIDDLAEDIENDVSL